MMNTHFENQVAGIRIVPNLKSSRSPRRHGKAPTVKCFGYVKTFGAQPWSKDFNYPPSAFDWMRGLKDAGVER